MNTKQTLLLMLLSTGFAGAQDLPTNEALRAAIALSELEHDDAAARDAMVKIAEDESMPMGVKRHAWLHFARLSRRLGEEKAARVVLERAARGNDELARRAREMLAEEPQDPKRERELRERAEVAVEKFLAGSNNLRDVAWFGDTAATILIREFEGVSIHQTGQPSSLISTGLWQVDSDVARTFLREQLNAQDTARRRAAMSGLYPQAVLPTAHLPLLRTALADEDAEVVIRAIAQWKRLGIDDLAPKIADPRVTVRLRTLRVLQEWTRRFSSSKTRNAPERNDESKKLAKHLPVPLAGTDPEEFRLAAHVLCMSAAASIEGRALLARSLTKLGDAGGTVWWPDKKTEFAGPNENAEVLRAAFEELGPVDADDPTKRGAYQAARSLSWPYLHGNWDRSALDAVLTGARLGYIEPGGEWVTQNSLPEDTPRIIEAVAASGSFENVIDWIGTRDLPEECFEPLRKIADDRLPKATRSYANERLLIAIGGTEHPDAAPYLRDVAARPGSQHRSGALNALVFAGHRRNDQPTRDALRSALLAIEPEGEDDLEERAAQLFGQLVRMGDVEVFDDPDAMQAKWGSRGIALGGIPGVQETWAAHRLDALTPGSWLAAAQLSEGTVDWWHGYTDEEVAKLWRKLLAPRTDGSWRRDWQATIALLQFLPENRSGISSELALVLCDAFTQRCASDDDLQSPPVLIALHKLIAAETRALWQDDTDVVAGIDSLRSSLWTSPTLSVRKLAAETAELPLDEGRRARLIRLLADSAPTVAKAAWDRLYYEADLPIDADQVASGLSSRDYRTRRLALQWAAKAPVALADVVRPALRDDSPGVRSEACVVLGATLRLDVVPDLLTALKDTDADVRLQARAALQSIRFYHDEKAHWDRVFAGKAGLTAASAAEALLDQAKPGNDPDTRILAIRSLGTLAAAETLPFLIEWTKDPNTEIADTARAAIGAIHTK